MTRIIFRDAEGKALDLDGEPEVVVTSGPGASAPATTPDPGPQFLYRGVAGITLPDSADDRIDSTRYALMAVPGWEVAAKDQAMLPPLRNPYRGGEERAQCHPGRFFDPRFPRLPKGKVRVTIGADFGGDKDVSMIAVVSRYENGIRLEFCEEEVSLSARIKQALQGGFSPGYFARVFPERIGHGKTAYAETLLERMQNKGKHGLAGPLSAQQPAAKPESRRKWKPDRAPRVPGTKSPTRKRAWRTKIKKSRKS